MTVKEYVEKNPKEKISLVWFEKMSLNPHSKIIETTEDLTENDKNKEILDVVVEDDVKELWVR